MRDKIAGYMELAGRALPAEQILREVLNIRSPNAFAAERVLRGILGKDARFHHRQGLWHLTTRATPRPVEPAALDLQIGASYPRSFRGAVHTSAGCTSWEFLPTDALKAPYLEALQEARQRAENCVLLVWSGRELRLWNRLLRLAGFPQWRGQTIAVSELAARMISRASSCRAVEDLAPLLGLAPPDTELPAAMARFLAATYQILLDLVPAAHRASPAELARWIDAGSARVDFSRFAFGRDFIARTPDSPGVYLMRDRAGEVIYVGKSGNLRRRVRSYFTARALKDPKTARIHNQLYAFEILTCATEVDALLLEMRMIRDFRPAINLQEEVHERPARYGHDRNLVILVPSGEKAEIYFLKDGSFVARLSVALGSAPTKKLCARIRSVYFGTRCRKSAPRVEWETEIVARWLSANRKRLNFVDVDEAGGSDSVIERLASYLKDPDRLAHKVYYR
jgi:hypothetical protein